MKMRKLYMIFTLVVLLSMATSVEALDSKMIERDNGVSATALWTETKGDLTTDTLLSVIETNDGTDVYLDIYIWGPEYSSWKSGYMFTKDDIFSIDKKLNSASLSEVTINVDNWDIGQIEPLTVKADWTGIGDISTSSFTIRSKSNDYVMKFSDNSMYRSASAKGSINNCDLGANWDGSLSRFKSASIIMEK
jgi:hypothetical protein